MAMKAPSKFYLWIKAETKHPDSGAVGIVTGWWDGDTISNAPNAAIPVSLRKASDVVEILQSDGLTIVTEMVVAKNNPESWIGTPSADGPEDVKGEVGPATAQALSHTKFRS
jgi:hypothetical protein